MNATTTPAPNPAASDTLTGEAVYRLHVSLSHFNHQRMQPGIADREWRESLQREHEAKLAEGAFIEAERKAVAPLLVDVPQQADAFVRWFEDLANWGPGQGDRLFPWLAEHASLDAMRWFVAQEVGGEAGFDDLVALTQVGFADRPKLEMARNYWDEMGRGHAKGMHGPMLTRAAQELDVTADVATTVWEALALANLMAGLAANRRYAYQSVGALGVVELTAPGRVALVNEGLRRLGVSAEGRKYFQVHAALDVKHSQEWNREVLHPLVAADPRAALPLAEGALLRLHCGARCFTRYRRELRVP